MFANPVFITPGSFIVIILFLQRVDILLSFNYWLHDKYVYLKTLRRWSKSLAERKKRKGGLDSNSVYIHFYTNPYPQNKRKKKTT